MKVISEVTGMPGPTRNNVRGWAGLNRRGHSPPHLITLIYLAPPEWLALTVDEAD